MRHYLHATLVAICLLVSSCSANITKQTVIKQTVVIQPVVIEAPKTIVSLDAPKIVSISAKPVSTVDLNCLAKGIYYEARGESTRGKEAVGFVIINRTKVDRFPGSICGVVKQSTVINHKVYCQFSWYCTGGEHMLHANLKNDAYQNCLDIAESILSGTIDNWLPDAISFHVTRAKPRWNDMVKVTQIGNHIFYKFKS